LTKKKNEEEEFEPFRQIYSPGFYWKEKEWVFEQVDADLYFVYNVKKGTIFIKEKSPFKRLEDNTRNTVYLPLKRVPWPLAKPKSTFTLLETEALWDEIRQFIYDHVDVVEDELYDVLTAWVFASYLQELWMVVPYLFFYGPVATGKTRGLEVLQTICYRGIIGSNVSTASLFRGCELWHPTIFLDETEIYSRPEHIEVIGLLNSGYRRGQFAWRVKNTEYGTELELFDVFGFKGLSGTEKLAITLESRSIKIRMIKNTRPVRFLIDLEKAQELRAKLLMWRFLMLYKSFGEGCEGCEPFLEVPSALKFANGRLIELFQPLLAVANEGRENIVKYAKKVYEIRQLEEETSVEAMILNALVNSESKVVDRVILTKDIRDTLNEDIPEKERFKTTTVGKILRRLGFLPKHTRRGNGWIWNDSRLKLLKSRYLPGDIPPLEGSQGSQGSQSPTGVTPHIITVENQIRQKNLVELRPILEAEKCELCGQFPVSFEFIQDGQKLRRCDHCIEEMKSKGMKFTTLREVE